MIQMTESVFFSSNGQNEIYYREYLPDAEPKAIVQLAHGVAEHILRYDHFARYLASQGYIVVGTDHLGHGRSLREKGELGWFGDNQGWERLVEDMHTLHIQTARRHPGLPYFLFGHSMGSFLARTYVIRYGSGLDGVILSGTGHQSKALLNAGYAIGKMECRRHGTRYRSEKFNDLLFGKNNAGYSVVHTAYDWLSRDDGVVSEYVNDPLCGFLPTVGLLRDMLGGMLFITRQKNIVRMRKDLPVYFMSGDCDPVGENGKGVIRAYKAFLAAGMKDVTMKLYASGRHEMLNELNRDEVYRDITAWLDAKCGKLGQLSAGR